MAQEGAPGQGGKPEYFSLIMDGSGTLESEGYWKTQSEDLVVIAQHTPLACVKHRQVLAKEWIVTRG